MLAHDVAAGKTTTYYAREQAEELQIQSSNLADALGKRPAPAAIERRVREKGREAERLSKTLRLLHEHPSDKGVAEVVERRLEKLGGCG